VKSRVNDYSVLNGSLHSNQSLKNISFKLPDRLRPFNISALTSFQNQKRKSVVPPKSIFDVGPRNKYKLSNDNEYAFHPMTNKSVDLKISPSKVTFMPANLDDEQNPEKGCKSAKKMKIKLKKHGKTKSTKMASITASFFALSDYCKDMSGDIKPVIDQVEFDSF
jgi:hypothetical protein